MPESHAIGVPYYQFCGIGRGGHMNTKLSILNCLVLAVVFVFGPSLAFSQENESAERINNKVAEFSGIDKITGRIITFDVYIDETVQFGALQVTPRVCYSRPITEKPKTTSFLERGKEKGRLFLTIQVAG